MVITIGIAESDRDILSCFSVMKSLRDDITREEFLGSVKRLASDGYKLACLWVNDEVLVVAGFRIGESLAWGRYIYIDDLVSEPNERSKGYGARMMSWLRAYGREMGCKQLHLDTSVTRHATHKFYFNQGLFIGGYHFAGFVEK